MAYKAGDYVRQSAYDEAAAAAGGNAGLLESFAETFGSLFNSILGKAPGVDQFTDFFRGAATPSLRSGFTDYASIKTIATDYIHSNYPTTAKATGSVLDATDKLKADAEKIKAETDLTVAKQVQQKAESGSLLGMMGFGSTKAPDAGSMQPLGGSPANAPGSRPANTPLMILGVLVVAYLLFRRR